MDAGQVENSTPVETEVTVQEDVQENKSLTVKERLAQRFEALDTSKETIEDGGETNPEVKEEDANVETNTEATSNKYQVLVDNIYTIGEGDDIQELSGAELKDSLLRRNDYTTKTQELADKRKEVESKEKDFVETISFFDAANEAALGQFKNVDWNALQAQNPAQYQNAVGQYQQLLNKSKQINQVKANFTAELEERAEKTKAQNQANFKENIKAYIPDWNDNSVNDFLSLTEHYDIPEEEIRAATNPIFFAMAKDALAFRNAKTKAIEAVKATPPKITPTRNSTSQYKAKQGMSIADRIKQRVGK